MLFRIILILPALIFAAILEISVFREAWFFHLLGALVIFSVISVWPVVRKTRLLAIPFFLSLGSLSLLFLIDSFVEKQIFVFLSGAVFYLALLGGYRLRLYPGDKTAQGMINLSTIATVFLWYASNYGWYLNFQISPWVLVLTFIGSTFLLTFPSLVICEEVIKRRKDDSTDVDPLVEKSCLDFSAQGITNRQIIFFFNFILALIMGEVIWSLALWPFAYLTTSVVALIIYFVFWDWIRMILGGQFSQKAFVFNIFLASFSILGILLTAQWELIV